MTDKFTLLPSNYKSIHKTKMKCDGPLTTKRTILPPFINERGFFMIIVGKPKSGKTTFVFDMLVNKDIYKKVFKNILYVCPQNSRDSIDSNPLADLDNEFLFESLNDSVKTKVEEIDKEYKETPEKHYQQLL
jgi:AAA15 family ATPase/GTPase